MNKIGTIIANYRSQLESAGLLRRSEAVQLSPKVAAMPTSFTKARLALQEYTRASVKVQDSPMTVLFEYTFPKLEPLLIELGEEKAEQIVNRICEHGKEMIEKHIDEIADGHFRKEYFRVEGTKEHLEGLFKDLPELEAKIREENGIEEIIETYRNFDFGVAQGLEDYMKLLLGDGHKIFQLDRVNKDRTVELSKGSDVSKKDMKNLRNVSKLRGLTVSVTSGLEYLRDLRNLKRLTLRPLLYLLKEEGVHLNSLTSLEELQLWGHDELNDFHFALIAKYLKGLINVRFFSLQSNYITDDCIKCLKGIFPKLQTLGLSGSQITDDALTQLKDFINLKKLILFRTKVSESGIEMLKKSIPGLEIEMRK